MLIERKETVVSTPSIPCYPEHLEAEISINIPALFRYCLHIICIWIYFSDRDWRKSENSSAADLGGKPLDLRLARAADCAPLPFQHLDNLIVRTG